VVDLCEVRLYEAKLRELDLCGVNFFIVEFREVGSKLSCLGLTVRVSCLRLRCVVT